MASTANTVTNLRRVAIAAYLQSGGDAQSAWMAVRGCCRRLRAPHYAEAVAKNSGHCRSYRSPLGDALAIPGCQGEYGDHCAAWPRTVRSWSAAEEREQAIDAWLESQACALV